jgi:hypothetical protein
MIYVWKSHVHRFDYHWFFLLPAFFPKAHGRQFELVSSARKYAELIVRITRIKIWTDLLCLERTPTNSADCCCVGMAIQVQVYPSGTRPDGYGYRHNFLPVGGTRTRPESRRVWDGYFFPPTGNPTGTWYFTTGIILGCEQVKMCSFCYINYDLFWLLKFATLLSQIFVEY